MFDGICFLEKGNFGKVNTRWMRLSHLLRNVCKEIQEGGEWVPVELRSLKKYGSQLLYLFPVIL